LRLRRLGRVCNPEIPLTSRAGTGAPPLQRGLFHSQENEDFDSCRAPVPTLPIHLGSWPNPNDWGCSYPGSDRPQQFLMAVLWRSGLVLLESVSQRLPQCFLINRCGLVPGIGTLNRWVVIVIFIVWLNLYDNKYFSLSCVILMVYLFFVFKKIDKFWYAAILSAAVVWLKERP
jgi:hypothetical protein